LQLHRNREGGKRQRGRGEKKSEWHMKNDAQQSNSEVSMEQDWQRDGKGRKNGMKNLRRRERNAQPKPTKIEIGASQAGEQIFYMLSLESS
jgi:hypothetical protein